MKTILVLSAILCLLATTACRSMREPGSTSTAMVQITGHTLTEIQDAAANVFGKHGYSEVSRTSTLMIFNRAASRMDQMKYGDWSGDDLTMSIQVKIVALAGGNYRLQADVYAEQDASDPFFASEDRARMLNRHPYKKLLDEVEKELK